MDIVAVVYLIIILVWFAIIISLKLYIGNYVSLIILLVPVIVFGIAVYNDDGDLVSNHSIRNDDDVLTIGLILLLPLLYYMDKQFDGDKTRFVGIIIFAIFLSLLTTITMWVPRQYARIAKYARSGVQTLAITLVLYSLYMYYDHRREKILGGMKHSELMPLFCTKSNF